MKKIIVLLIVCFPIIVFADKTPVTLIKCVDGDTARFLIDKNDTRVRFLSIDAPEIAKEDVEADPYGDEAANFTCERLKNANSIFLEYDEKSDIEDKYGRVLAWVWVDNDLLQSLLVEKGLAKVKYAYKDYKYNKDIEKKEQEAKDKKSGIWSNYVPKKYKVTFVYDDKKDTFEVNEKEQVQSFTPVKEGYKFIGWMLDGKKFDFNNEITSDIILIAKYEKDIPYNYYIIGFVVVLIMYLLGIVKRKRK